MTHRINNDDDPIIGPPQNINWDDLIPPTQRILNTILQTILIIIIVTLSILFWATFVAGINALWIN